MQPKKTKAKLHTRYPLSSVLIYNGSTILHFLLGGIGIALGYSFSSWAGYAFAAVYLVLALAEMYVLMPLRVCPNCVYHKAPDSLCISGLNVISKRIAQAGDPNSFARRAEGCFVPTTCTWQR